MGSELVKPDHLDRKAVVYVRQSTQHQVITNQESLKLQYALSQRARELGWREADIDVIDSDLGQSGAGAAHRKGFKDLVARVTLGEIGLVLSMDVTRLARNCSDWYPQLPPPAVQLAGMNPRFPRHRRHAGAGLQRRRDHLLLLCRAPAPPSLDRRDNLDAPSIRHVTTPMNSHLTHTVT